MLSFSRRATSAGHKQYFLAMADRLLGRESQDKISARVEAIRRQWFAFDIAGGAR
jgi:hypothetical protein